VQNEQDRLIHGSIPLARVRATECEPDISRGAFGSERFRKTWCFECLSTLYNHTFALTHSATAPIPMGHPEAISNNKAAQIAKTQRSCGPLPARTTPRANNDSIIQLVVVADDKRDCSAT
jgi:hypothetical protein